MLYSLAQLVLRLPHCIPLSIGPTTDGFRIYETRESASDCPKMLYHKAGDTIENVNHEAFLLNTQATALAVATYANIWALHSDHP